MVTTRSGAKKSEAIIANWWRQGMIGGAKAHYDGIVAFSPPARSMNAAIGSPAMHRM
jgi:hypothetical protein